MTQHNAVPLSALTATWVAWLISLWCLFLSLSSADPEALLVWVSSDSLYPVNVFTDTVLDGYSFSGWRFSIAPCWFPDLIAIWIFMAVVRNPILATLLAGFAQIAALAFGMRQLWKSSGFAPHRLQDTLLMATATPATLYVAANPAAHGQAVHQLFLPQTHVGTMVVEVFALGLAVSWIRTNESAGTPTRKLIGWYIVLCLLGGMSDLLFCMQMLAPITVVAGTAASFRILKWRSVKLPLTAGWAAALAGFLINSTLFNTTTPWAQANRTAEARAWALNIITRGFTNSLGRGEVFHLLAGATLVTGFMSMVLLLRALPNRGASSTPLKVRLLALVLAYFVVSAVISPAAIVLGGNDKNYADSLRYIHPTLTLPLFILPFVLGSLVCLFVKRRLVVNRIAVAVSVVAVLPAIAAAVTAPPPAGYISSYRPPLVRDLDELARTEGLKVGFAGYWQARLITLRSTTQLRAYAVDKSMAPFLWVSNAEWYLEVTKSGEPKVDFVVLDDRVFHLDLPAALEAFGPPVKQVSLNGTRVLLYRCKGCPTAQPRTRLAFGTLDQPLTQFSQKITSETTSLSLAPGQETRLAISLTNPGSESWSPVGRAPVSISYKLYAGSIMLPIEGERTVLPGVMTPGETRQIDVRIVAPPMRGNYKVRVTLVQEGVDWFMTKSGTFLELPVTVR